MKFKPLLLHADLANCGFTLFFSHSLLTRFRMATAAMSLLLLLVGRGFEGVAEICFSAIHDIDNTCYLICGQKSSNVCRVEFSPPPGFAYVLNSSSC